MSRNAERDKITIDSQVRLINTDLDQIEKEAELDRVEFKETLKWVYRCLIGSIVSLALSLIGVAVAVMIARGR